LHTADGTKTVFKCLSSELPKSVRVDGIVVEPLSSDETSVTFADPPLRGVSVEIMYDEIRTDVDRTPGTPPTQAGGAGLTLGGTLGVYGYYPLPTEVNTAESIAPPVIELRDEGAEDVVFTLDPEATQVEVFADGRVLSSR